MRRLFHRTRPLRFIGAHDAISARLGEEAGFDGIWASGLEISASHGLRDDSSLSREQMVERVGQMGAVTAIPVLVDADTGYGDGPEAAATVHAFEQVGAAGICIEDKVFPKRNSFASGPQALEAVPVFVAKLQAALAARRSPLFAVVARTEALIAGVGKQEAEERMHAFSEAGADAVVVHSKSSSSGEVLEVLSKRRSVERVGVIPTTYFDVRADDLSAAGASFIVYANQGLRAKIAALRSIYAEVLNSGSTKSLEPNIAAVPEIFALQDRCARQSEASSAKKIHLMEAV